MNKQQSSILGVIGGLVLAYGILEPALNSNLKLGLILLGIAIIFYSLSR
ncbi:MAG: hypothetical protein WC356_04400 [Candidatus Micrarchaeia archaeon]|jgi:hypothetical protein